MARKSVGTWLQVRGPDGSRSATRNLDGTQVPSDPGIVGVQDASPQLSADEVDSVHGWAMAALLGDVPEVDIAPGVMELIRARRAS